MSTARELRERRATHAEWWTAVADYCGERAAEPHVSTADRAEWLAAARDAMSTADAIERAVTADDAEHSDLADSVVGRTVLAAGVEVADHARPTGPRVAERLERAAAFLADADEARARLAHAITSGRPPGPRTVRDAITAGRTALRASSTSEGTTGDTDDLAHGLALLQAFTAAVHALYPAAVERIDQQEQQTP